MPPIKDWVEIGFNGTDGQLFQLWEHIRRYMEESGVPISPGDRLRQGVYDSKWKAPIPQFPSDVIEAAGGHPLSESEMNALADSISQQT